MCAHADVLHDQCTGLAALEYFLQHSAKKNMRQQLRGKNTKKIMVLTIKATGLLTHLGSANHVIALKALSVMGFRKKSDSHFANESGNHWK